MHAPRQHRRRWVPAAQAQRVGGMWRSRCWQSDQSLARSWANQLHGWFVALHGPLRMQCVLRFLLNHCCPLHFHN